MEPHLLVADRDRQSRESLKRTLERRGYEVETAGDGLECIARLMDRAPAALLLDLGLLWGGAEGVLARMRNGTGIPIVPVILMTDKDKPEKLGRLVEDPVIACFRKPLRIKALLQWLREAEHRSIDTADKRGLR